MIKFEEKSIQIKYVEKKVNILVSNSVHTIRPNCGWPSAIAVAAAAAAALDVGNCSLPATSSNKTHKG